MGACGTAPAPAAGPAPARPQRAVQRPVGAGTAPGAAGTERRAPPRAAPAEMLPAAQDHHRILQEIQADTAGGFLSEICDDVSRGHGCSQHALMECAAKGIWPGYSWNWRRGGTLVSVSESS